MALGASTTASVDRLAGRTGLSGDAIAILMILAGVLVIVFPKLLTVTVGLLLIIVGAWWLIQRAQARRDPPPAPGAGLAPPPP